MNVDFDCAKLRYCIHQSTGDERLVQGLHRLPLLKKNLANKIFGYLARCEENFCI